jgi:hypothetical protein
MSYHTLVYNGAAVGVNAVNTDINAAVDTEIQQRNNHYVFTEKYRLMAAALIGASVTRGRFQCPRFNYVGELVLFNANRSLQPPSNPQWDLYGISPLEIPQNEEFQVQVSNNLGAATEQENVVLQILPDDFNLNLPRGDPMIPGVFIIRATVTITPTLNAWSGPNLITLVQSLRGGVYAVVGTVVQGSNAVAYRWIFPRNKVYHGRRLRPGGLIQNAVGDTVNNQVDPWVMGWGLKGQFSTLELPSIEVFGTVAGAITYQIFMWVVRITDDINALTLYTG